MRTILLALFAVSCFRESPPCDAATLERIKAECPTPEDCYRQIEERERVCLERFRRGE